MQYQLTAALALFVSSTLAQIVINGNQTKPFNLIVDYEGQYNGTSLDACHEGAGIESLCLGVGSTTFVQNYTAGGESSVPGDGPSGPLSYLLKFNDNQTEPESMDFFIDPSTNVAHPQLTPGYGAVSVAFDQDELLNIVSVLDDTVTPPADGNATALYRWVVCKTNYAAYQYTTLNWVLGKAEAQNPSCEAAKVRRVFVS